MCVVKYLYHWTFMHSDNFSIFHHSDNRAFTTFAAFQPGDEGDVN